MLHQWLQRCLLVLMVAWLPWAHAEEAPLKVVATFSILGDMVKAVGGDHVQVQTLVGPDGDVHDYQPTPADAKTLAEADILFVNGLGLEGWLDQLIASSGYTGKIVTVTEDITSLPLAHADENAGVDPHAWQNLAKAKAYVHNINRGLQDVDPLSSVVYAINRDAYLKQLTGLEQLIADTLDKLPEDRRKIVTNNDAFGYFADAYRLTFIAPQGISTETEATTRDAATLIEQIRAEKITAVFLENMFSPQLLEQITTESGAKIGGTLYADALSPADGEAGTYLQMMQHNIETLYQALKAE